MGLSVVQRQLKSDLTCFICSDSGNDNSAPGV